MGLFCVCFVIFVHCNFLLDQVLSCLHVRATGVDLYLCKDLAATLGHSLLGLSVQLRMVAFLFFLLIFAEGPRLCRTEGDLAELCSLCDGENAWENSGSNGC